MLKRYDKNGNITFWGRLFAFFKNFCINVVKDNAVKILVKRILGAAAMGGVKAWILAFIIENLYEEVVTPLTKGFFRKVGYYYEVRNGKHSLKEIENAEDRDSWRDAIRYS